MEAQPRCIRASNPSPFTLDGTRTYLVGRERVAVIDPGPDVDDHVRALASVLSQAREAVILLTHGHRDHAGGARRLAQELGAEVVGPEGADVDRPIRHTEQVHTDAGTLVAVATPGHTADHLSYYWAEPRGLFVGDLFLGRGDTTWVGEYPGCVADYLHSLERVRMLAPATLYPAHGPPLEDPADAIERFAAHRRARIDQVAAALRLDPHADAQRLLDAVYGVDLPPDVRRAALRSVEALAEYVRNRQAVP